jgi:photosystem II stability/assembly factor-like uncharacterized protein
MASVILAVALVSKSIPQVWAKLNRGVAQAPRKIERARLSEEVSIHAAGRGNPWISLSDGRELMTSYIGPEDAMEAIEQNQAQPLSLASADFDEDGVADLVCGYEYEGRGIIALHRGNVDSIYPNSPEAKQRRADGTFTDAPFLSPALLFAVSDKADFIGAGDFDADGHWDVVVASRSGNKLNLLSGDGRGGLGEARQINLPGAVTAMVVGEINRRDGLDDVVVGVSAADGAKAMVFEGPEGALRAKPEIFNLPAEATDLALGQLDYEESIDLAIASHNTLVIAQGRDRKLSLDKENQAAEDQPIVNQRDFPFAIRSLAIGDFEGKQKQAVALLTDQSEVMLLSGATAGDARKDIEEWHIEAIALEQLSTAKRLLCARVSGLPADDLVAIDSSQHKLRFIVNPTSDEETVLAGGSVERKAVAVDVDGEPAAALAMRLNGDAIDDIVVLRSSHAAPIVMPSAVSSTITVNSTLDTDSRDNVLTLREAILISNGQLSVNDLTAPERAQISGTPTSPGMDEIRFNITSSVASVQPSKADEAKQTASAPIVGFGAGFGLNGVGGFGVSGFTGITSNLAAPAMQSGTDQWMSLGPFGGLINALAIDPTNPNTIYAGTFSGGVFKTTNGGSSWNAVNSGLSNLSIEELAIDPTNPNTIYAGAGASGVYKTTNGGSSWNAVNSGLSNLFINTLAIDPTNPNTIYAGAGASGGVFKTTNGGSSWNAVNSGLSNLSIEELAIDPTNPNTIYAGTFGGGVHKTTNGGSSWNAVNSGLPDLLINSLAIDPTNPSTIYAGSFDSAGTFGSGVYKTTNGGSSWNAVNFVLSGLNITSLAIDPTNPSTIYAGSLDTAGTFSGGVFKTTNGGSSWNAVNSGLSGLSIFPLAIDPTNPNTIYAGYEGSGVYKTTNGGSSWNVVNSGLSNRFTRALAIDPTNPNTIYAGLFGDGVYKTTNGGSSWNAVHSGLSNLFTRALAIDPTNPNTIYAGSFDSGFDSGVVFKSTNGGSSWNAINSESVSISSLAIDPTNPNTIYAGSFGSRSGVYKTTNGGSSWNAVHSESGLSISSLAIDPTNPNTIYAGYEGGGVFKTTNGGSSWNAVNSGLSNLFINTLAMDPTNPNTIYAGAGTSGGVFKTTNGGSTWAVFGIGLSQIRVRSIAIDPLNTSKVYAGTNNSVFGISSTGCTYTLSTNANSFPTSGGSGSVTVNTTAGCNWTATSNASWITVNSGSPGTGTGTVNYSVAPNTGSNFRTGSVTIAGQLFTVSQSGTGSDCIVTPISFGQTVNGSLTANDCLSPFRARLADRYSFNATAGQQVAISLSSSVFDSYLYLVGPGGNIIAQDDDGAGNNDSRIPAVTGFFALPSNGTYTIEVTSFSGTTAGDYTLMLTQGTAGDCSYTISPNSANFSASAGNGSVNVTAPAGCNWTAVSNAPFITITSGASGSGNSTINYSVAANSSTAPRTGTITIAGQTFTVTQAATPCSFSISPTTRNFPASGGNNSVSVTAPAGCNWTAVSNASFITITSGASGSGNGTVNYSVSANSSTTPRSGTMTIAGLIFTVTQDGNRAVVVRTINLSSPLPKITDAVVIDGTTQPGVVIEINANGARGADVLSITAGSSTVRGLVINKFNTSNTRASGILLITNGGNIIEGCFIGTNATGTAAAEGPAGSVPVTDGISIRGAANNRIGGTVTAARNIISGNDGNGITISNGATSNRVQGNYIGTDVTGSISLGHQRNGVYIIESSNNIIGGSEPGAGNLISGNIDWGIYIGEGSSNNTIQGNLIGTDATGTRAVPNGNAGVRIANPAGGSGLSINAIEVAATVNNTIGGTSVSMRNIISGNDAYGVAISDAVTGTQVQGNYIGTNLAGTGALANGYGVIITQAVGTVVGGESSGARNIISGNNLTGIIIGFLIDNKVGGTGSTIQGNYIGADVNGAVLGNKQHGVFVEVNSSVHTIRDNRVAFNGESGVRIPNQTSNPGAPGVRIRIEDNAIYSNGLLGIDLGDAGVTPNDPLDADGGANEQQNFPVLISATTSSVTNFASGSINPAAIVTVNGTFSGAPNVTVTLKFYLGTNCPAQGSQLIGIVPLLIKTLPVTTDGSGNAPFTFMFNLPDGVSGGYVNGTATSSANSTSEFARCIAVGTPSPPGPRIAISPYRSGKNLIVEGENFDSGAKILINGAQQKTSYESSTRVIGKKAGKKVKAGDKVQVRNSDGTLSNEVTYSPP